MELPIFPLNAVLFPSAQLPLHIFEDRYRLMIRHCIDEQAPFGVCLIQKGNEVGRTAPHPFETGTTAHIANVQELEDGRMNIVCVGGNRFKIREVKQETPFIIADVEVLGSAAESDAQTVELAVTAAGLFAEYVRLNLAVANQWTRAVATPSQPAALSHYIGARLSVDLRSRQMLLEATSPKLRLQSEVELIAGLLRELGQRVQVARANRWLGFGVMN